MPKLQGTVSRAVPLDAVLGRALTISGTFRVFVTDEELVKLQNTLTGLQSSGILTDFTVHEDGTIDPQEVAINAPVSPSTLVFADSLEIPIAIPDAATATYVYKVPFKCEVVDVIVRKSGAGASNTIQVTDSADAAISDAIAAAVDKAVTRAGTLDPAKTVIAAGGTFKVVATRANGSMLAFVIVKVIKRL